MPDTPTALAPDRTRASRAARVLAAIAFCLAALAVPLAPDAGARASTHGAGWYDSGHWHGSYFEGGTYAYCLDYHLEWDGGASPTWAGTVTSYRSLSPGQLGAIGAAVAVFGQTSDAFESRALADAIWYLTDGVVPWGATAGRAQELIGWMAAWVAAPAGTAAMTITATGPQTPDSVLTIDAISSGAPVTGRIQLADAVFVETGSDAMMGEFVAGQALAIRARPTTGAPYRISATLAGTSALSTPGPAVPLYTYGAGYQGMVGPPALAVVPVTGAATEPDDRAAVTLTTRTAERAPVGTGIRDTAVVDDLGTGLALDGWALGFELYAFAEGDAAPVCTPDTRVFVSGEIPVAAPGEYESDAYPSARPGVYGWVATLYDAAHEPQAVGECGDPGETVVVEAVLAVTGDATAAAGTANAIGLSLAGGLVLSGAGFVAAAARQRLPRVPRARSRRGTASVRASGSGPLPAPRATPPACGRSARGRRG